METKSFTITKHDGNSDRFSLDKIMNSIVKAFESVDIPHDLGCISKVIGSLDVHEKDNGKNRQNHVRKFYSPRRIETPELSLDNILTPEEIDEMYGDLTMWPYVTERKKRKAREGIKQESQPQQVTNITNIYFFNPKESNTNMTPNMEQLRSILGQYVNFNDKVVINNGDGNVTYMSSIPQAYKEEKDEEAADSYYTEDLLSFSGKTVDERKGYLKKVGERLHDMLKAKKSKDKGISELIVRVIEDCYNDEYLWELPNANGFNRLFKPYLADNIVKVESKTYNDNVVGKLRNIMAVKTQRQNR